ncbi:hypothetical protein [Streptacidiphilus sp. EB103A]|uniref:hypothetical protein n=1 Tax=Streptacidiphilus sp. EB103A TaxID=3156275 RepID=UPI003516D9A2
MTTSTPTPQERLVPTGLCFCGCGADVEIGRFFARGHDIIAAAALRAVDGATLAQRLSAAGYGPQQSVVQAAVQEAGWQRCDTCPYAGAPASLATHIKRGCPGGNPQTSPSPAANPDGHAGQEASHFPAPDQVTAVSVPGTAQGQASPPAGDGARDAAAIPDEPVGRRTAAKGKRAGVGSAPSPRSGPGRSAPSTITAQQQVLPDLDGAATAPASAARPSTRPAAGARADAEPSHASTASTGVLAGLPVPDVTHPVWAGIPAQLQPELRMRAHRLVTPVAGTLKAKEQRNLLFALRALERGKPEPRHWLALVTADRAAFGSARSERATQVYQGLEQLAAEYFTRELAGAGRTEARGGAHAP